MKPQAVRNLVRVEQKRKASHTPRTTQEVKDAAGAMLKMVDAEIMKGKVRTTAAGRRNTALSWKLYSGVVVREKRMALGMTAQELSKAAGISQPHLSHVERGKANVSMETMRKVAGGLGMKLSSLAFLVEKKLDGGGGGGNETGCTS